MPTLKENIDAQSGVRTYDEGYVCPVLGPVIIQSLSEEEFQEGVLLWAVNQDWTRNRDRRKYENAKLLQMSLVDENKNLIYSDTLENVAKLARLRSAIFTPLYNRAYAWNQPALPKN
ncbi:MAG: hypothetical protein V4719_00800 [Planctomycetota bacterium]